MTGGVLDFLNILFWTTDLLTGYHKYPRHFQQNVATQNQKNKATTAYSINLPISLTLSSHIQEVVMINIGSGQFIYLVPHGLTCKNTVFRLPHSRFMRFA